MATVAITIGLVGVVVAMLVIAVAYHACKRSGQYQEAEQVLASFIDFNQQVSVQLTQLQEQGRLCYQSLDGDAMRLMYEAQKAITYGIELERLGKDALSRGDASLLSEVKALFDIHNAAPKFDFAPSATLGDLSPRDYKLYAINLIQQINKKIEIGLKNRNRLMSAAML